MSEQKNYFWFSTGMFLQRSGTLLREKPHAEVMINGKWTTYTNWTTTDSNNTNWDDIVLIGSITGKPKLRINGIIQ